MGRLIPGVLLTLAAGVLFLRPRDAKAASRLKAFAKSKGARPEAVPDAVPDAVREAEPEAVPDAGTIEEEEPSERPWPKAAIVGLPILAAVAGAVIVGPAGAVLGVAPLAATRLRTRRDRSRTKRAVEEAVPEAVEVLADAMRAKGSLRLAVGEVAATGPRELRPVFDEVCRRLESGYDIDGAAAVLGRGASSNGLHEALLAIRLHTSSGGNLAASLETVAGWARGRVSVERELRAATAQGRMSGLVVALAPVVFALISHAAGIGGAFLFGSPAGVGVLAIGLALDAAGYLWIRKICEIRW